jgi:hypothetical protein
VIPLRTRLAATIALLAAACSVTPRRGGGDPHANAGAGAGVSMVVDAEPANVPGESLRAVLVEPAPAAESPSHRRPPSAFVDARMP